MDLTNLPTLFDGFRLPHFIDHFSLQVRTDHVAQHLKSFALLWVDRSSLRDTPALY